MSYIPTGILNTHTQMVWKVVCEPYLFLEGDLEK